VVKIFLGRPRPLLGLTWVWLLFDSWKSIIFVGLNTDLGSLGFRNDKLKPPKTFYNIHADYKFYIDILVNEILQQKFYRQVMKICNNKEKWLNYPDKTQQKLNYDINISLWNKETEKWNKLYKKKDYKFMNRENIFIEVIKLLNWYII